MIDPLNCAKDPETPPDVLATLAQDTDVRVVRALAANRVTSASTLSGLSNHTDTKVRVSVAGHRNTPTEALVRLAGEPNDGFDVYEGPLEPGWRDSIHGRLVGRMESYPEPEILDALSQVSTVPSSRSEPDVAGTAQRLRELHDVERIQCLSIAKRIEYLNPRGPAGVASDCLAVLASDAEVSVRVAVAKAFRTTAEVRRLLAADPAAEVRLAVAEHPRTPADVLLCLWESEESSGDIAVAIARNRSTTTELLQRIVAESDDSRVLWSAAAHSALGEEEQKVLLGYPDIGVQMSIAGNRSTVPERLEVCSQHESSDVRTAVARNWSAPATAMLRLARDEVVHVRLALAGRLDSRGSGAPPLPDAVCELLVRDSDLRVRERLFKRHNLPWSKEEREHLRRELKDLQDSLRPIGHPDFPRSDTARVPRLHGLNKSLTEGIFLTEDEVEAWLADHAAFLNSGGSGGRWHQMWVGQLLLTTYLGEPASSGKQLSLFLKRIPQSISLARRDLRFANLSSCFCERVNLSSALLGESVATDGFWAGANFAGADLTRVDFSGSDLRGACFAGANLYGADFEKTDCSSADFTDANLDDSRWPGAILDEIVR